MAVWAGCLSGRLCAQWTSTTCSGNPCIYYNSGIVGIGTASPVYFLDVENKGTVATGNHDIGWVGRASYTESGLVVGYHANGSHEDYPILRAGGYTASGLALAGDSNNQAEIFIQSGGNVGIGTTSPQHLLHVAGIIGAEEVIVSSTGADYVFLPGYRLMPLAEVGEYIRKNRHLPGIPSAREAQKTGMSLGDMQGKLLAKVEELTLHMIRAEERSQRLEAENRELRDRVVRLESHGAAAGATSDRPGGETAQRPGSPK